MPITPEDVQRRLDARKVPSSDEITSEMVTARLQRRAVASMMPGGFRGPAPTPDAAKGFESFVMEREQMTPEARAASVPPEAAKQREDVERDYYRRAVDIATRLHGLDPGESMRAFKVKPADGVYKQDTPVDYPKALRYVEATERELQDKANGLTRAERVGKALLGPFVRGAEKLGLTYDDPHEREYQREVEDRQRPTESPWTTFATEGLPAMVGQTPGVIVGGPAGLAIQAAEAAPEGEGTREGVKALALGWLAGKAGRALESASAGPAALRLPAVHATVFPLSGTVVRAAFGEETTAQQYAEEGVLGVMTTAPRIKGAARAEGFGKARKVVAERQGRQAEQDVYSAEITQEAYQKQQDIELPRIKALLARQQAQEAPRAPETAVPAPEVRGEVAAHGAPQGAPTAKVVEAGPEASLPPGVLSIMDSPVGRIAKEGAEGVVGGVKAVAGLGQRLITRVRSRGPVGENIARRAETALDAEQKYHAKMTQAEDAAFSLTHRGQAREFQKPEFLPGKDYGPSRFHAALEGKAQAETPAGQTAVDATRRHLDESWTAKRDAGIQRLVYDPVTETAAYKPLPETNTAAPRVFTPDALTRIRSGDWKPLAEAVADGSKWGYEKAAKVFEKMQDAFTKEGPQSAEMEIAAEFVREVPFMPGWTKGADGKPEAVLESNAFHYNQSFARSSGARVGYTAGFGQGPTDTTNVLREAYRKAGYNPAEFTDLTRALHRTPVETPFREAGFKGAAARRGLASIFSLSRGAALSTNALNQGVGEIILGPGALSGRWTDQMRGLGRFLSNPKAATDRLRQKGLVSREYPDLTIDPTRPITSRIQLAGRALREIGSTWMEEIQGRVVGTGAEVMVERIRSPDYRPSERDIRDLVTLGMPEAKAREFAGGGMGAAEAGAWGTRLMRLKTTETQGENVNPAQLSRFEHSRLVKTGFAFIKFWSMFARNLTRRIGASSQQIASGFRPGLSAGQRSARIGSGIEGITKAVVGTAAAGTVAQLSTALVLGGKEGVAQEWRELKEDPIRYGLEALKYAVASGPLAGLAKQQSSGKVEDYFYPVTVLKEFWDAFGESNPKYRGQSFGGRVWELTKARLPLAKSFDIGLLGSLWTDKERRKMLAAKRGLYSYLDKIGAKRHPGDDEVDAFDVAMARLGRAIDRKQPTEEWERLIREAAEVGRIPGKENRSVAQSLKSRRILDRPELKQPGQMEALKAWLGEEGFALLQARDAQLERVAAAITGSDPAKPKGLTKPMKPEKPLPSVETLGAAR